VREVVEEAVQETVNLLKEFDEINAKFGEEMSDDEMSALLERQGEVQEKLDALDAWDLDSRLEMAMDALRCPPPDTPVKVLQGGERRRVRLCRLLLQKPEHPLARRADKSPRRRVSRHGSNITCRATRGTIIAVTHDRYFLDNVAGWILELDRGQGIPWKGNYSSWLEQKQERLRREEEIRDGTTKNSATRARLDSHVAQGRHAKGKARINSYEDLLATGNRKAA
jgi:ATPase subunit of ABC transporter with duplicated ATPase domains